MIKIGLFFFLIDYRIRVHSFFYNYKYENNTVVVGSSVAEPEPVIFAGSSLKEPALANVLNYNLKFKY